MFTSQICPATGEATINKDGRTVGTASFANAAQRHLFEKALAAGTRPARAAEEAGAIYLPA
jgi:hypothetical protein